MTQFKHADDIPQQQGSSENFTGTTYIQPIASAEKGPSLVARVNFEQSSRTFWHVHSGEQVLYFLEGRGRVQLRGQKVIDASPGDVVHIPPLTEHWHGAHPNEKNRMRHLAITYGTVTWLELESVTEDEYQAG